jgi:protein-arginine kinase activator protein McsA
MAEAGMLMDENAATAPEMPSPVEEAPEPVFEEHTLSELEEMLEKAVEQEDYEKASLIRDEIRKRKKK